MKGFVSNISITNRSQWGAFLLLLVMVFLSSGTLPFCLDFLDSDTIEISENCESEADSEKKENKEAEANKYLSELFNCSLWRLNAMISHDCKLNSLFSLHSEIPTPPPELV